MRRLKGGLLFSLIFIFLLNFFPTLPAKAASATLYFAPGSGTYVIGSKFNVGVKVDTGGDVVNSAEGSIAFDNNLLEVVSVSKGGSIFPFWTTEPVYDNGNGTIRFGGGLPPPAYNGSAGHVCTITFRAKKSGSAAVRFATGAVLAHDGKGTNVLASMGSASFIISPKSEAPAQPTQTEEVQPKYESDYNKPEVKSESHPDPNSWYNNSTVSLNWEPPEGVSGISIAFDQEPTTDPGPVSDGNFTEKKYENTEDGIWYFHIKYKDNKRWGTIEHFRIMIDTRPPKPFEAEVKYINVGDWPELHFDTEDESSGLKLYEVIIGSLEEEVHIVEPEVKFFKTGDLEVGEHTAMIKAIDNAGNETYSMVKFKIDPIDAPQIENYAKELKSSDNFYISGTSLPDTTVFVYIGDKKQLIASSSVKVDSGGKWFYLLENNLDNGRYYAWAEAVNKNGIKSNESEKVTFLVSPPVFAVIGSFVINYFTVLVSLLFMIVLVILIILWIVGLLRKRLKKETVEVEQVLKNNLGSLEKEIDKELFELSKYEGKAGYKKAKANTQLRVKKRIELAEKKILKEVKDVEDILK